VARIEKDEREQPVRVPDGEMDADRGPPRPADVGEELDVKRVGEPGDEIGERVGR
jgi:hypothetical protein